MFYHRSVEDFLTDEIQLYILNQEQENGAEKPQPDKHHLLPRSVPACSNPSMLKLEESGETDKNTLSLHHQDCRTFIVYHLALGTPKELRGEHVPRYLQLVKLVVPSDMLLKLTRITSLKDRLLNL